MYNTCTVLGSATVLSTWGRIFPERPFKSYREQIINTMRFKFLDNYRNVPKFSDRQAWVNSADSDQTAPEEQSDQGLHCLQFPLHLFGALL